MGWVQHLDGEVGTLVAVDVAFADVAPGREEGAQLAGDSGDSTLLPMKSNGSGGWVSPGMLLVVLASNARRIWSVPSRKSVMMSRVALVTPDSLDANRKNRSAFAPPVR